MRWWLILVTRRNSALRSRSNEFRCRCMLLRILLKAYGALGMARSEFVADSASCQIFWLLFDSDLTPAGDEKHFVFV